MGRTLLKTMLGAAIGAIAVGSLSYGLHDTLMRPQGMGGGMGGWGHGLDSFLAGNGGALVGLVGGGLLAWWLDRRPRS